MAITTEQKFVIVAVGGLLVWHFMTAKPDPEKDKQIAKANLSDDYRIIRQRLKDLRDKVAERLDLCSKQPHLYKKQDFIDHGAARPAQAQTEGGQSLPTRRAVQGPGRYRI